MNSLRQNLLAYIGYCLVGKFSYDQVSLAFTKLGIAHEPTTLRKEFSLLKKEGLITFRLRYRKPHPVLTTKGKLEIKTRLAFKKFGLWDKKWRVILFDLPQNERKYRLLLVDELRRIGAAPLSRGAYISPYPILGVIEKRANYWGIRQNLQLITAEKIDNEKSVAKHWPLEQVNCQYLEFIKTTERIQRHSKLWPLQAKRLEQQFAEIFTQDPHLPAELLPTDWQGKLAYEKFKEISNSY
jgi:phenylacetic acid degradation operon negative regulatory protein